MRPICTSLRLLLCIVISIVFMAAMPIYDEPFGGCKTRGFATLELGCTLWLDVLLGFSIVFLVACFGQTRWRPQLWGFAIVMVVASIGGLSAIKSGIYLNIFSHPDDMAFYWSGSGVATFFGGLLGVGFYYLFFWLFGKISG